MTTTSNDIYVTEADCASRREKLNDATCAINIKVEKIVSQISALVKVLTFVGTIASGVLVAILVKLLVG